VLPASLRNSFAYYIGPSAQQRQRFIQEDRFPARAAGGNSDFQLWHTIVVKVCHGLGYIRGDISPVGFGFVFSPSFIFNNIGRFVFSFVFSTGTYFQQLLRFVFRFVPVCFLVPILCFQQPLRFVFQNNIFFCPICLKKPDS
jgi:hypothetical protein